MSDLILDDAQQMLAGSVRRYVERGYGDAVRGASIDHPQGCSPDRQLHGAIGMTEEYAVGQFIKRLALASTLYGGVELQLERLAEGSLGDAAACP